MCEMLANQYYITRKYKLAEDEFTKVLIKNPANDCAKKKLINCYIELGKINKAFDVFYDLIMNNIDCFLKCDFEKDECPCVEIIYDVESYQCKLSEDEKDLALGMLWLPLNINESMNHFNKALGNKINYDKKYQITLRLKQIINLKKEGNDGK